MEELLGGGGMGNIVMIGAIVIAKGKKLTEKNEETT